MKKKSSLCSLLATFLLAVSCQQTDWNNELTNQDARVSVDASIRSGTVSRTTTVSEGTTSFVAGDAIGFFMPESHDLYQWEYDGSRWSSPASQFWPNQQDEFTFHAFYPYAEEATFSGVPMPDLGEQTGKLAEIGAFDFLTASRTCNYASGQGKVDFVGESAFGHVYGLIIINLLKNEADAVTELKSASFEGEELFSRHTYDFATSSLSETVGEAASRLNLTMEEPVEIPTSDGYELAVLVNPSETAGALSFSIAYERDEVSYKASTNLSETSFASGKYYRYKIRIQKQGLVVEGCEVTNWEDGNISSDDIIVTDTPDVE